jgi:hypothetical protein
MNAETLARALEGRPVGASWMACCPVHDDREPSLSLRDADGAVLVHCHAGCEQRQVIAALRRRGLWSGHGLPNGLAKKTPRLAIDRVGYDKRRSRALAIWNSSKTATGTLVETYLASRGVTVAPPHRLRFHPGLKHSSGGIWPAMVALVTDGITDAPVGVHRTFLASDGRSKAPVKPPKMMLGPCRGGAVRLGGVVGDDILLVGEGIETCLSAMQATGLPAWVALSTSGLRSLFLPDTIEKVTILADGDEAGENAARDCARRWQHARRRVRVARPLAGMDFNDMLLTGVVGPRDAQ